MLRDFMDVKKYVVRYASYFSLISVRRGENFRKRIRKFGKRCFLDVRKRGEDNVYTRVMEVTCLETQVSSRD